MAQPNSVDELIKNYPSYFQPQEAKGVDGVVQLHLAGEDGGEYYLRIHDQQCEVHEGVHDDPTVSLKTTAENWLKINRGEANPMGLMMKGQLKVNGSIPMATKMQSLFSMS